jgi:hypothetical protein
MLGFFYARHLSLKPARQQALVALSKHTAAEQKRQIQTCSTDSRDGVESIRFKLSSKHRLAMRGIAQHTIALAQSKPSDWPLTPNARRSECLTYCQSLSACLAAGFIGSAKSPAGVWLIR